MDLVFADDEQIVHSITQAPPLGHSDVTVEFSLVHSTFDPAPSNYITSPRSFKNLDWSKADFCGIQNFISCIDWYQLAYTTPCTLALWDSRLLTCL